MSMSELDQATPKTTDIKINGKTEHCEEVAKGKYKIIGSSDGKVYDKDGNLIPEKKIIIHHLHKKVQKLMHHKK